MAKTTHNGQNCGITDLNGNMWELELGLTMAGSGATSTTQGGNAEHFYILRPEIAAKDLTSGWVGIADPESKAAFGHATYLNQGHLYDQILIPHILRDSLWRYYGNGSNQVLSEAVDGIGYSLTGLGFYKDVNAESTVGTNLFGNDGCYEYRRHNLFVRSSGGWSSGANAGVWAVSLNLSRSNSSTSVGFRSAYYL
jgi:hypothetical protein